MIVTAAAGQPAAAASVSDDRPPRLSDSSGKAAARDHSPVRRLLGSSSLQQQLTRRSSSPLGGRRTVTTTTTGTTRSPSASPVRDARQQQHRSQSPSWANQQITTAVAVAGKGTHAPHDEPHQHHQPSPPPAPPDWMDAAAGPEGLGLTAAAAPAGCDVQQQPPLLLPTSTSLPGQHSSAGAGGEAGLLQLQPSPVVCVVPDATGTATTAEVASLSQHLAGKRKFLEGTNSTELLYEAHAKSPLHTFGDDSQQQQHAADASNQRDQQQQQQLAVPPEDESPFVTQAGTMQLEQEQQQQQQPHHQGDFGDLSLPKHPQQLPQQQQQQHRLQRQGSDPTAAAADTSSPLAAAAGGTLSPLAAGRHSNSPGLSTNNSGGGDMKPPSLVDMARRVLGRRPELFGVDSGSSMFPAGGSSSSRGRHGLLRRSKSGNAAAAAASNAAGHNASPKRTVSHDVSMMSAGAAAAGAAAGAGAGAASISMRTSSMATASMQTSSSQDGAEGAAAAGGTSLYSEPSFSMGQGLPRLSGAASLEVWLGPGSSRTTSGSPKSMGPLDRQQLLRTSSSMSTGSGQGGNMPRQSSLVFGGAGANSSSGGGGGGGGGGGSAAGLDKQASFAGWPQQAQQLQQELQQQQPGVVKEGSFAWPAVPMRTISEDSLKLDIQMLPPVVPEDYPPEPPPGSFAAAGGHDGHLQALHAQQQREQQQREQQQIDRAFFVKVAAWEDELVEMLEGQAAPVAIRNIVSVFKDRIHSERDKSEFKALCDKWTGVVEYPAGSGVKCLAIKSWMRGTHARQPQHVDDDDDDDVGSWDD